MKNTNQFTIIFLLLIIGIIIYYLTRPTDNETFNNNINNTDNTVQLFDKPIVSSLSTDNIDKILAESNDNTQNINNIEPNDTSLVCCSAQLSSAFQQPDIVNLTPDLVNTNKNNVDSYNVKDFLPKEINDQWFDTDFSQAKYNLKDDNLINTERYIIGINTVGQSLKNASWDIRGSIPNPKFSVSPWNNSTIEADYNIKPLC